jgi:hypothetical protein
MRRGTLASIIVIAVAMAATATAQFGRGGGMNRARLATAADFDGGFQFCRIVFRQAPAGDGGGWGVDYPRADENLSIRLRELTRTPVSFDTGGNAKHLLVRFTDPQLFSCPFVMMTEPGGAFLDEQEAAGLRAYVLKGGFLWADDFWGEYAWAHWVNQLQKALPAGDFQIFDLPTNHPLMNAQFQTKVMQIPSIGWTYSGSTSERVDSTVPHARGIADKYGRLMVLMTHNTDYGDSWEREGDDPQYFYNFGPGGYALGINTVLYAMTH